MTDSRLKALPPHEFQEMTDAMLSEDFDKVTVTEFFGTLAAMDEAEPETIELTAHIEAGRLVLEEPAPLVVAGNEIYTGNKRIVIHLRKDEAA